MSKNELVLLKKGKSSFELIGNVKLNDFTFKLEQESQKSDWIYNSLNLGIDCGVYGMIYGRMMSGYGSNRNNVVYVHGKKEVDGKERDNFENRFTIAWEDRFDEDVLETVGSMNFINIGIELDEKDEVVYKKFLTEYDAINYLEENLVDGMRIKVKGNLSYREYEGKITIEKHINKIYIVTNDEVEDKASFVQSVLLDCDSIGKADKETRTVPLSVRIIENIREYGGQKIQRKVGNRIVKSVNIPIAKELQFPVGDDIELAKKMLKAFKVKSKKTVTQMVVEGHFSRGEVTTVEVTIDDLDDDIKELIELGLLDEKDILGQVVKANTGNAGYEMMIVDKPHIIFVGKGDKQMPQIDKVIDMYTLEDLNIDEILKDCFVEEKKEEMPEVRMDTEAALKSALEDEDDEDEDEDDWLKDL